MQSFEEKYYEASRFWEGEGLHDANNTLRIKTTANLVPSDTKSLADIGCGNGVFLNYLKQNAPSLELLGVDRSRKALEYVKTEKLKADINKIPIANGRYDCITCLEVIEHLPVTIYTESLKELARISNKFIIVSVPYMENLEENHTQCPQCKTIFNADLHMRSFNDIGIQQLLEPFGFRCLQTQKFGERFIYKGHYQYRTLFYRSQFKRWWSPICPLCGFESSYHETVSQHATSDSLVAGTKSHRSLISYFTGLPKLFWPKERRYYEIMALYQKTTA